MPALQAGRWQERALLVLVAGCMLAGVAALDRAMPALSVNPWSVAFGFLVLVLIAHLAVSAALSGADQTLLPMAALLSAIGLVFVIRLEPDRAVKQLEW